jgi:hypothetical protein
MFSCARIFVPGIRAGAPGFSCTTIRGGSASLSQIIGRAMVSPSSSVPVIRIGITSARRPGGGAALRTLPTVPSAESSFSSCLRATRSSPLTWNARAISRLPTGVGLSAMKVRI